MSLEHEQQLPAESSQPPLPRGRETEGSSGGSGGGDWSWGAEPWNGNLVSVISALQAIADRERAADARRESDLLCRAMVEAAEDFIFLIDLAGRISYVNRATAEALGCNLEVLLGQPIEKLALIPSLEETYTLLSRVITGDQAVQHEAAVPLASGTRHLYTTLSPVRDEEGKTTGILGISKDVTELTRVREELRIVSMVDQLTGLYNRRGFLSLAGQRIKLAERAGRIVGLVFVDVDMLKTINDQFGHRQGDVALVSVASILKGSCREADVVARIGGDEFAILASDVDEGGSAALVTRLHRAIEAENRRSHRPYQLSVSVGVIESRPTSSCTVESLLEEADKRMYEAKRARAG